MRTDLVLDALEQALHDRRATEPLVHHSDRGSQYLSIHYTDRLAEAGIEGSVAPFVNSPIAGNGSLRNTVTDAFAVCSPKTLRVRRAWGNKTFGA